MKKKIELNILLFILIRSLYTLFFYKNSLLSLVLGGLFAFLLILIYNKLNKFKKFTKYFLFIASIILSIITLKETSLFIQYNILKDYSLIVIAFIFIASSFLLANKDYHAYIKSLELSTYFIISLIIISFSLSCPNFNIHNYNLQLVNEITFNYSFIKIGLIFFLIYSLYIYLSKESNIKVYVLSVISIIITKLLSIGILGETLFNLYKYPYINILKRIKYLDFLERMEGILSFQYLFLFFFLLSFLILIIKTIIKDILPIKKDKINVIILSTITIVIFIVSMIL